MAEEEQLKVSLGGKGSSSLLSPSHIFHVAHSPSLVLIDSSALERLRSHHPNSLPILKSSPPSQSHSDAALLSPPEVRATLLVLLNKLLQAQSLARPFLPLFLAKVLNKGLHLHLPVYAGDADINLEIVRNIYKFKDFRSGSAGEHQEDGVHIGDSSVDGGGSFVNWGDFGSEDLGVCISQGDELGVTENELEILRGITAASPGIAALSLHLSTGLCLVADTVAGLSCEALQANIKIFDSDIPADGLAHKQKLDVASDMRVLLLGSKLVSSKKEIEQRSSFASIPIVHGSVREDVKRALANARIEIHSSESACTATPILSPLTTSLFSLVFDLYSLTSNSVKRLHELRQGIEQVDCQSVSAFDEERGPSVVSFQQTLSAAFSKLFSEKLSGVLFCIEALKAVLHTRKVLTWEAAAAIKFLNARESSLLGKAHIEKSSMHERDANSTIAEVKELISVKNDSGGRTTTKGKQNSERKKKGTESLILGRGTRLVRQLLSARLQQCFKPEVGGAMSFAACAEVLEEYFDPRGNDFQSYADNVKRLLESNESRRVPKIPKGTRDNKPEQMAVRKRAFEVIESVFERHGAVAIDTPVFELRETLMGKYGEDSKLIFDLADQGGELCSLRYDLTVPFARYVAAHSYSNIKRYHIARVYRRDNPSKGRFREFYQCDFDIAGQPPGQSAPMLPDCEVIKVLTEVLDELNIGDYQVKLNHRRLLDGMLEVCGVQPVKFRTICSAIDKLDKLKWEQVRAEMVEEKGLSAETADRIGNFVQKKGSPLELLSELRQTDSPFLSHEGSCLALEELSKLFGYLQTLGCLHRVVFDLSLARGLDYYTGVIYEAVFKGSTQVGSIAAGGRYDNLIGMFSGKQVPAVGVSLGIERVFAIMESENESIRATQTEVLVVALGDDANVALQIVNELWASKIKAEFSCVLTNKLLKQLDHAKSKQIPWVIFIGHDELDKGIVRLQSSVTKEIIEVPRICLVRELQNRSNRLGTP